MTPFLAARRDQLIVDRGTVAAYADMVQAFVAVLRDIPPDTPVSREVFDMADRGDRLVARFRAVLVDMEAEQAAIEGSANDGR
jgi:hypothetical protein